MSLRAYELAKQLGVPTKKLIDKGAEIGIVLHNNFTTLTPSTVASFAPVLSTALLAPIFVALFPAVRFIVALTPPSERSRRYAGRR